jgi:hypothetical protein
MNKLRSIRKSAFLSLEPLEDRSLPAILTTMPLVWDADVFNVFYTLGTDSIVAIQDGQALTPLPCVAQDPAVDRLRGILAQGEAANATPAQRAAADLARTVLQEYDAAVKALRENTNPAAVGRLQDARDTALETVHSRDRNFPNTAKADAVLRKHGVPADKRERILRKLEESADRPNKFNKGRPYGRPSLEAFRDAAREVYPGQSDSELSNRAKLFGELFRAWPQPR